MASRTVTLFGGPYHGRVVTLEGNQDHFHVLGEKEPEAFQSTDLDLEDTVKVKRGTYSKVRGEPFKFEWDGWVDHG